jgi:hypothetical protein
VVEEIMTEAEREIGARDFSAAYSALHRGLEALGDAGLHLALAHHLVLMGDMALDLPRPDLALLNFETAARLMGELGDEGSHAELNERCHELDLALRQPFSSLEEELDWLIELVRHFVRRTARHNELRRLRDPSQHFEFEISAREFEIFCEGHYPRDERLSELDRAVVAFRGWTARRQLATADGRGLLVGAMRRFGLEGVERSLLVVALLPALSPEAQRAFMRLWGDYLKRVPDVAFLAHLVSLDVIEERQALQALGPTSRLCRSGLLRVYPGELPAYTARLHHAVSPADSLVRLALGQAVLSPFHKPPVAHPEWPVIHEAAAAQLGRLLARPDAHVCLEGPTGAGKRSLLEETARALGLPVLEVRLVANPSGAPVADLIRDALSDTRLSDGVLLVDATRQPEEGGKLSEALRLLFRHHAEIPCRLVFAVDDPLDALFDFIDRRALVKLSLPNHAEQEALWRFRLTAAEGLPQAHERIVKELVERFP